MTTSFITATRLERLISAERFCYLPSRDRNGGIYITGPVYRWKTVSSFPVCSRGLRLPEVGCSLVRAFTRVRL